MLACPNCALTRTVKNGRIHTGKQRYKCLECGRQFVEQPTKKVIDRTTRSLIDRLLLERISFFWHGSCCRGVRNLATAIRESEIRRGATRGRGHAKKKGRLTMQCDDLWSFVDNKGNKQWVWLAQRRCDSWNCWGLHRGKRWGNKNASCGHHCLLCTGNARLPTPIFGLPMQQFCRPSDIELWVRKRGRPVILSDLITPCASVSLA